MAQEGNIAEASLLIRELQVLTDEGQNLLRSLLEEIPCAS
jgi:hypothetical protein